jgi:hypothetical protein
VATQVTGWLSPLLFCASILLLGRSFYVIYVRKTSSRLTTIVAWCSLTFMISFWSWYVLSGRLANEHEPVAAKNEETKNDEKPLVGNEVSPQTITLHVPEMKMRGGYEGAELT